MKKKLIFLLLLFISFIAIQVCGYLFIYTYSPTGLTRIIHIRDTDRIYSKPDGGMFIRQGLKKQIKAIVIKDIGVDKIEQTVREEDHEILRNWVNKNFQYFIDHEDTESDFFHIIKLLGIKKPYNCGDFAKIYIAVNSSFNIPSRYISLRTIINGQVGTHATVEFFSDRFKKWYVQDPTFNVYFAYNDTPLSALEIRKLLTDNEKIKIRMYKNKNTLVNKIEYDVEPPYLFSQDIYIYNSNAVAIMDLPKIVRTGRRIIDRYRPSGARAYSLNSNSDKYSVFSIVNYYVFYINPLVIICLFLLLLQKIWKLRV
ncbi:MAG: transglutaminase domain-containing protein [bacterium]